MMAVAAWLLADNEQMVPGCSAVVSMPLSKQTRYRSYCWLACFDVMVGRYHCLGQ